MKHTTIIVAIGLALTVTLSAAPAYALAYHTFVSPTGSDSNPCTLALPCRNLQAALEQTTSGGEIAILGTAGYSGSGTLTIDRAISIVNTDAYEARISPPSGGIGIVINASGGDAVSLRGLTIDGAGVGNYGIQFNTGLSLTIENCVIRNFNKDGIDFIPSAGATLFVSNTPVANNGSIGIYVVSASGVVTAAFNRVEANNNNEGIAISSYPGTVTATVSESVATGNGYGFASYASGSSATLVLFHSVAANNGTGLYVQGTNAVIRAAQSMVTGNPTAGFQALNSGVVQSYGDNYIDYNGTSTGTLVRYYTQ